MNFPLPETITRWRRLGNDGFGRSAWSAPTQYAGRIAYKQEEFTDQNGDRQMSTAVAYSEGDLQVADQVLFGASTSISPPAEADDVRAVSQIPSGSGELKKAWFS